MNLLVTGGCGFIGSHFVNNIHQHSDGRIVNLDAMYYAANTAHITDEVQKSARYTFVEGNIANRDLVKSILQTHRIDHIVHFAAQSHAQTSFYDSLRFTQDNVLGTHTLLEAVREYGKIQRFIHISTDEVYGESDIDDTEAKHEQSVLCPTNPYAATKAAAELIAKSEYFSFQTPIIVVRSNNVYGTNQHLEKLIPRFIHLLKQNKKVTIQGDGSAVRGFLYVDDMIDALKLVLEKGKIGETYNIAYPEPIEHSVLEVAKMLIKTIQKTTEYDKWIEYIEDRPFNDKRYYISSNKIVQLGWSGHSDFAARLKYLVPFY